jgi:hypothetical protein
VDAVVNLAGAGIADKPWTSARKKVILESRTQSTALLARTLSGVQHQVRTVVMASAMGYYGLEDKTIFTEEMAPGNDFLAGVVREWEAEADKFDRNLRVVKLRVSVVLSREGGALRSMERPMKFHAGTVLGSGRQPMSWIHMDDLCNLFVAAIENENMRGPYNAVAPQVVDNRIFTKALARKMGSVTWLPRVPGFALRLILGEMADLVLKGIRLSPERAMATGFVFHYPTLEKALDNLYA